MALRIEKATRSRRKARVGLLGPTGSGKTLSALLLARGFGGRACVIDTENHSAGLYVGHKLLANWEYDVIVLEKPYSIERYLEAIGLVEEAGYDTMIVDSCSHAWVGPGGILEFVDKHTNNTNKFVGWREATPKHNNFVERLVSSPCHVICTMRVKMDYILEENDKGKMVPKKVGLQPVQREGLEYEFDVVFDIATKTHDAVASKDRTSLFDGQIFTISTETGSNLLTWLQQGKEPPKPDAPTAGAPAGGPTEQNLFTQTRLQSEADEFELSFVECATLPDLAAQFDKAQKRLRAYCEHLGVPAVAAPLGRLVTAKDKRKAALAAAAAAPAGEPGSGSTTGAAAAAAAPAGSPAAKEAAGVTLVGPDEVATLEALCQQCGLSPEEGRAACGVERFALLPLAEFAKATDAINLAADAKRTKAPGAAAPAGDLAGDPPPAKPRRRRAAAGAT